MFSSWILKSAKTKLKDQKGIDSQFLAFKFNLVSCDTNVAFICHAYWIQSLIVPLFKKIQGKCTAYASFSVKKIRTLQNRTGLLHSFYKKHLDL